ncbi:ABC transporter ATP-binding protein [Arvimicrobium flavum]|uniref:ABC transporter ATP-binding protein n=1 Tax=Arvimicrobium flavum TaxID=3393320 RepID=UPI00237B01D8|nr:ABC transporter ATP-binding protein [Mesorhizobium shangrilense]
MPRRSAPDTMIETRDLTMEFAGFRAVDGVNLAVKRGDIHALIGPNGAGKTTCFNMITKFLTPTRGQVFLEGRDVTRTPPAEIARDGIVRSFQISAVFQDLTAIQNVCVALQSKTKRVYSMLRADTGLQDLMVRAGDLLEMVGLWEYRYEKARFLSYGRKRALELATTLAMDPKVMLLDEPMAGMSPEDVRRVTELIVRLRAGRTVLMVEHNLNVVAEISDRITVLARGKVLAEGSYQDVSGNTDVQSAYIGAGYD